MKGKKGFQPGHKDRMQRKYSRGLSQKPYCFKPYDDQVEAMREIEGLAEKLRKYVDQLI